MTSHVYPLSNILGTPPKFRATLAAVVSDGSLRLGQYVQTYGYYAYGDGGANTGVVVAGGAGTDDGGSFTDLDNGLQVQWLFPGGVCNVKQWGGVGDGDVANMAVDTKAVQKCFDYAAANKIPVVESLDNIYIIDGYKGNRTSWSSGEWAHGGIIARDGLVASGFHLKNGADNWRCVLRLRSGTVDVKCFIVDGDVDNYDPIPEGTTNASSGSVRGEGIICEGGGTLSNLSIIYPRVKNTGHYGIGLQDVSIDNAFIQRPVFSNIGGDCIDGKSFTSGAAYKRNIIIRDVIALDGCGHNYVGKYDAGQGSENQAVIDMCQGMIVDGVTIYNLDSYDAQIGNAGVRFRAKSTSLGRNGSEGSQAHNIRVYSSKDPAEGTNSVKRIQGVVVNDKGCTASNIYVYGCFHGFRAYDTADGVPTSGNFSNITAVACTGAGDDAVGIGTTANTRDLKLSNLTADGCEVGISVYGQRNSFQGCTVKNSLVYGFDLSLGRVVLNSVTDISLDSNAQDYSETSILNVLKARSFIRDNLAISKARNAYIDIIATADDASWTGSDVFAGGMRVSAADTSGTPGEVGGIKLRASGSSGSSFMWDVIVNAATPIRFRPERTDILLPAAVKAETTAAALASAANAVNTTGKTAGITYWDTTNNRMMRARGANATDPWDAFDGSVSVTPA
jgi:hypothetical protein